MRKNTDHACYNSLKRVPNDPKREISVLERLPLPPGSGHPRGDVPEDRKSIDRVCARNGSTCERAEGGDGIVYVGVLVARNNMTVSHVENNRAYVSTIKKIGDISSNSMPSISYVCSPVIQLHRRQFTITVVEQASKVRMDFSLLHVRIVLDSLFR